MPWADGDDLTPTNLNNQVISSLTIGGGGSTNSGVLLSAITLVTTVPSRPIIMGEMIGTSTASGIGQLQGVEGYVKHTAASGLSLGLGAIGNAENAGTGTVDVMEAVRGGGWFSNTGSVTTFKVFGTSLPATTGTGRPGVLVAFEAISVTGNTWSGTTNYALLTNGVLSVLSSQHSLPSVQSGRGYLYVSATGGLYWVGGSGTSTEVGAP